MVRERYPDASVYRLTWGAKELNSLTGLVAKQVPAFAGQKAAEQLVPEDGGDDGADSDEFEEIGAPRLDEFGDAGLVGFGFGAQVPDPAGQGAHGLGGAVERRVAGGAPAVADLNDLRGGLSAETGGEGFWAGGGQGDQLAFGVAGHLDCGSAGDQQGSESVAVPGVAGCGQVIAGESLSSDTERVEVVGLLAHASCGPAGAVDFPDVFAEGLEPGREAAAPAAAAFDHPTTGPLVLIGEDDQLGEPDRVGAVVRLACGACRCRQQPLPRCGCACVGRHR